MQAKKVWRRIHKRYELSNVWRLAPSELIATEFLSLLRSLLAPLRIECALYDSSLECPLLAATLPKVLIPIADDTAHVEEECGFVTAPFFEHGGTAVRRWKDTVEKRPDLEQAVAKSYVDYLTRFGAPDIIYLNGDRTLQLRLLVNGQYDAERVRTFVADLDLPNLLRRRPDEPTSFHGEWQSLSRRLADYLLHEFIDRLENDLAVTLDSEAPEIWVLLMDGQTKDQEPSLQFHTSTPKLQRILDHYTKLEADIGNDTVTVGALRSRVEGSNRTGDFDRLLAHCDSNFHKELEWQDRTPLTLRHLECIAEKFQDGWPSNRGIAGTVVATGCGEVIRDFASDYRVKAYEYDRPTHQLTSETDRFFRVRLAERIFIKTKPHVIELPLLWSTDANGRGRCTALLLVLFNGGEDTTSDYFARRALEIRGAVEPWHILFEQHERLMEWNRVIHGHVVHEARNEFQNFRKHLPTKYRSQLENRLEALWAAYSFVPEYQGSPRQKVSVATLTKIVTGAAASALQGRGYEFDVESEFSPGEAQDAGVETVPELIEYLLVDFMQDSASSLANLVASKLLPSGRARVLIRILFETNRLTAQNAVTLQIEHFVTPGEAKFLQDNGSIIGQQPVFTQKEDRRRAHLGLFYAGALLRGCGGEFLRPILNGEGRVIWRFVFPLIGGHPREAARRDDGNAGNAHRRRERPGTGQRDS